MMMEKSSCLLTDLKILKFAYTAHTQSIVYNMLSTSQPVRICGKECDY